MASESGGDRQAGESSESGRGLLDEALGTAGSGHVPYEGHHASAYVQGSRFRAALVPTGDRDPRSLRKQAASRGLPDTRSTADDEKCLPADSEVHGLLPPQPTARRGYPGAEALTNLGRRFSRQRAGEQRRRG